MHLFITDSLPLYEAHPSPHKCWIEGALVKAVGFLTEAEMHAMNDYNNSVELEAGESCLTELHETIERLGNCPLPNSPFIQHKDRYQQLYGLLFEPFSKFSFFRHMVHYWFRNFFILHPKAIEKVTFNLSHTYAWLEEKDLQTGFCFDISITIRPARHVWLKRQQRRLKNIAYFFQKYFTSDDERLEGALHLMLVTYKLPHHTGVLNRFYELIQEDPNVVLHIVLLDHDTSERYTELDELTAACPRIKTYEFKEFREGNFVSYKTLQQRMREVDPKLDEIRKEYMMENAEINCTWLNRAFETIEPDVCMVMSTHEIGRYVADVCNYQGVPSIHFDYGLFSDHHIMESCIDFTVRASISQAVSDIWKKRNDRSLRHQPIGFTKLDSMEPKEQLLVNKQDFFREHGFDETKPTIFFASSWAMEGKVYDDEKITIVRELSDRCMKNGWNLLIKKHPLEEDRVLEEVLEKNQYPRQKLFRHHQLSLNCAILFSDITTTQMSSIVLEALFYDQPVCFLSTSTNKVLILAGMPNNPLTPLFYDFDRFEEYLRQDLFHEQVASIAPEELARLKEFVLFSTDQQTSNRLLNLAKELAGEHAHKSTIS